MANFSGLGFSGGLDSDSLLGPSGSHCSVIAFSNPIQSALPDIQQSVSNGQSVALGFLGLAMLASLLMLLIRGMFGSS